MSNRRDYTGKVVYMGIDVHKKTYCCVSVCDNEVMKRDTIPANPELLLSDRKATRLTRRPTRLGL